MARGKGSTVKLELRSLRARLADAEKALAERDAEMLRPRQNETFYRAVVEAQTAFISRYLRDGTFTSVNDAACRLAKKKREELAGQSFLPYLPAEDRERRSKGFASLTAVRKAQGRGQLADGPTWIAGDYFSVSCPVVSTPLRLTVVE